MRIVSSAFVEVIVLATSMVVDKDEVVINSKPGAGSAMGASSVSVWSCGGARCTSIIGSISGGTVFSGPGSVVINGIPIILNGVDMTKSASATLADADKEDDQFKKKWDISLADISEVEMTGSGGIKLMPTVLAKDLHLSLTGSGDIKLMTDAKFDSVDLNLIGSGDMDLADSLVKNIKVALMGSGDIKHFIVTERGVLRLMGSGDISCRKAQGADISKTVMGCGEIKIH
jgi:hypothetical protein